MVDIAMTVGRVYGMIADPQTTLANNSRPVPPWWTVAKEHVLPIVIVSVAVHGVLSWALRPIYEAVYSSSGNQLPELGNSFVNFLLQIFVQFLGVVVWAAVIGFFAGALGGRNDFNAAFVLVALALTPYIVSAALRPIPIVGFLIWMAGFIYAMVILYRGVPDLVGVPQENRPKHLVLSLVSMLLAGFVAALILGPLIVGTSAPTS